MGAIRTIFAIIFILYGISQVINGLFLFLGMDQPISINPEGTQNTNVILSQIVPLPIFGVGQLLWGLLWIWIGDRVRKGGQQQVQRFSKWFTK